MIYFSEKAQQYIHPNIIEKIEEAAKSRLKYNMVVCEPCLRIRIDDTNVNVSLYKGIPPYLGENNILLNNCRLNKDYSMFIEIKDHENYHKDYFGYPGFVSLEKIAGKKHFKVESIEYIDYAIDFNKHETIKEERYFIADNKDLHRLDGPAVISYYGQMKGNKYKNEPHKEWYVNHKYIDPNILPIFENGKQTNNVVIDNEMKIKLLMFDREYLQYVIKTGQHGILEISK